MSKQVLRIALVWHGTVMQERILRSDESVTLGTTSTAGFIVPLGDGDETHDLITASGGSYTLNVRAGMTGEVSLGGTKTPVSSLAGKGSSIREGDWGVVNVQDATFFFQWVDESYGLMRGSFLSTIDWNTTASIGASAAFQIGFLIWCFLVFDPAVQSASVKIPDRFVRILTDEPPKVIEEQEQEEETVDETTSKRAGGEEGKFGEEEAEVEDSILPDHDGPLVDQLQTTELGQAFNAAIGQTGALSNIFGNNTDAFANTFGQDFATAGEGDVMVVGRGSGGLGMRGGGRGGGGDGLGRVHGVGNIDTGGGKGGSIGLGKKGPAAKKASVERGQPKVNGFLSREQIERVVKRHQRGIQFCYEKELQSDPALAGRIGISWTIGLDGRVTQASVTENSMGNRKVESCILREVQKMRFDQPDGGMVAVQYPFTFRSSE